MLDACPAEGRRPGEQDPEALKRSRMPLRSSPSPKRRIWSVRAAQLQRAHGPGAGSEGRPDLTPASAVQKSSSTVTLEGSSFQARASDLLKRSRCS